MVDKEGKMSKSIKLKNDMYWDSTGIVHNKKKLSEFIDPKKYKLIITEDKESGEEIEIPCKYKVGADVLDVYLNGERLIKSSDISGKDGHYLETGSTGSISNKIETIIDWNLEEGDILEFVVRGEWS